MIEFRDALTDLLEEFGTEDGGYKGELPEGKHMRVENKNFYFDIGQNNRGIYMRVSEVNQTRAGPSSGKTGFFKPIFFFDINFTIVSSERLPFSVFLRSSLLGQY